MKLSPSKDIEYYAQLKPYLDSNFEDKYSNPESHLSCASELIVGYELLKSGYVLRKKASGNEGPDFMFEFNQKRVWVEVVTPREGNQPFRKNVEKVGGLATSWEVDVENCKLSIISVIKGNKAQQFSEWMKNGVIKTEDIKILAINTKAIDGGSLDFPFIVSVLYGLEEVHWTMPESLDSGVDYVPHKPLPKPSGNEVGLGLFSGNKVSIIDGILYLDYGPWTVGPGELKPQFFANQGRKGKIGDLFGHWDRIFLEKGKLVKL
jgi:hypothetical protein